MDRGFPLLILNISQEEGIARAVFEKELRPLQETVFNDLGLIIPAIQVRNSRELAPYEYQLQIDDQCFETFVGIKVGEFWLNLPVGQLAQQTWWGKRWQARAANENSGSKAAIVSGDEQDRLMWQHRGYETYSPVDYAVFAAAAQLRLHAAELMTPRLAEYYLTKLQTQFPVLVEVVRDRFDAATLSRALQGRLRAQTSIKNFVGVLEIMLLDAAPT
jgi:flagellar biosynthesis component FlhA